MSSGAYQLFIHINKEIELKIGKLGTFQFSVGNYIYTGSAMKNLHQRVARHQRKEKKLKWHIDYLLNNENVTITHIKIYKSETKDECKINQNSINEFNASIPVNGFGSSDCKICISHLIKIE
jgi:Uri superfamily endonuclease